MNLPNKLTLARIIMIPLFLLFLFVEITPFSLLIATIIYSAACITDALDGKIARKYGIVTNFGKFLDPLADKALVMAALVAFVELGWAGAVPVILILTREFMVTSLRLVANSSSGIVIAAGIWGKVKTAVTMVAIITIMVLRFGLQIWESYFPAEKAFEIATKAVDITGLVLIWISAVLTIISGLQYLMGYWSIIDSDK